jgi:hypothetical protein
MAPCLSGSWRSFGPFLGGPLSAQLCPKSRGAQHFFAEDSLEPYADANKTLNSRSWRRRGGGDEAEITRLGHSAALRHKTLHLEP